ncbi:outer membrane lipid asymmetry maintenance protein MlaD [Roseomonas sp. CCTCC AB2023176]|uniref:outer membrane lipid asymmetry maintenance protein MlaD n=1 Tax=Roseomonas sp. CCTCC AB2023176 TaxID=3342640 RepID=UPI0035E2A102
MKGRSVAEVLAGLAILIVAGGFLVYAITGSGRSMMASTAGITLTARFDRVDGLAPGADVRIAGVKVGNVVSQRIDPQTFLAVLTLRVDGGLRIPDDTSAEITSEGLLGGKYVALVPGGGERLLRDGGEIRITQSAVSLESLLGRFIFSVTEMNQNRQGAEGGGNAPAPAPAGGAPR